MPRLRKQDAKPPSRGMVTDASGFNGSRNRCFARLPHGSAHRPGAWPSFFRSSRDGTRALGEIAENANKRKICDGQFAKTGTNSRREGEGRGLRSTTAARRCCSENARPASPRPRLSARVRRPAIPMAAQGPLFRLANAADRRQVFHTRNHQSIQWATQDSNP